MSHGRRRSPAPSSSVLGRPASESWRGHHAVEQQQAEARMFVLGEQLLGLPQPASTTSVRASRALRAASNSSAGSRSPSSGSVSRTPTMSLRDKCFLLASLDRLRTQPRCPQGNTPDRGPRGDTARVRSVLRTGRFPARVTGSKLPPLLRQLGDPLGLGSAARSRRSEQLTPRTKTADRVARSVCPYCAVGCGQKVYVKDERVVQIEGDPDSPISRGRLCPKGAGSLGFVNSPLRETKVKYRRPHGTTWEELDLETAMDMIADRIVTTREETWEAGERPGPGPAPHARAGDARRRDAGLRGELPAQEVVHRDGRGCRSRTRPAYDTRAPSPVWGHRSGAAAPPRSSRTCRTPTAS